MIYKKFRNLFSRLLLPIKLVFRNLATFALEPTVNAIRKTSLLDTVLIKSTDSGADYILSNMPYAVLFRGPKELMNHAINQAPKHGIYCEFGVLTGTSIKFIEKLLLKKGMTEKILVHGFDSFEGLQEDWSGSFGMTKGHFNANGLLPKVSNRIKLYKGFFVDTLPDFLDKSSETIAFIHLDADTYESTRYVLSQVILRIKIGTIIIFDEYIGYPGWKNGEFLAFQEIVEEYGIKYKYLGVSTGAASIVIEAITHDKT
jgi:hypothetical protein